MSPFTSAPTDPEIDIGLLEAAMERMLVEEYLRNHGLDLAALERMPVVEAKQLMTEASIYASLRLARIESTARLRDKIRSPN